MWTCENCTGYGGFRNDGSGLCRNSNLRNVAVGEEKLANGPSWCPLHDKAESAQERLVAALERMEVLLGSKPQGNTTLRAACAKGLVALGRATRHGRTPVEADAMATMQAAMAGTEEGELATSDDAELGALLRQAVERLGWGDRAQRVVLQIDPGDDAIQLIWHRGIQSEAHFAHGNTLTDQLRDLLERTEPAP